jgi:hypothetical protein
MVHAAEYTEASRVAKLIDLSPEILTRSTQVYFENSLLFQGLNCGKLSV